MQLCVSVQMPGAFGGYEGSAVYIDTEGSFMAERAKEVAQATVSHLVSISIASKHLSESGKSIVTVHCDEILDRVHLFRCHEITELLAVVESLLVCQGSWSEACGN